LRARRGDIAALARHFADAAAVRARRGRVELSAGAIAWLEAQAWPGNVRELENAVERAVVLAGDESIALEESDFKPRHAPPVAPSAGAWLPGDHVPTLDELERAHILRVLEQCEGQKTKAAALLGINRTTLWKKLRQYGIE
jgi:DNA-binding NtrC family response regulator